MTIPEFFSDSGRVQAYQEWLHHPITQRVLEIAKHHSRPMRLDISSGPGGNSLSEQALFGHGFNIGQADMLSLISEMDKHAEALKLQDQYQNRALFSDYGARLEVAKVKKGRLSSGKSEG